MSVYVDTLQTYNKNLVAKDAQKHGTKWCHLMTDSDDLEELHKFAKLIGLKKSWFQNHKTSPHYDLIPSKKELAISNGALPVSKLEIVLRCSRLHKNKEKK